MKEKVEPSKIRLQSTEPTIRITSAKSGKSLNIGEGFSALSFREKDFFGAMNPMVMVDHYTMTQPTFGAHPHAGISAVSLLFEDSEGEFHNRDTLGNDFNLMPGDLYWLRAGSGVIHDESPRPGARTHGLQVFVNLPSSLKKSDPVSLHVKAHEIPVHENDTSRVRIVLGSSNGIVGPGSPALPMTVLDGKIEARGSYAHTLNLEEAAWVYAIEGDLGLSTGGQKLTLSEGQAVAIQQLVALSELQIHLTNQGTKSVHFALFASRPVNEPLVQKGGFVMTSIAEIEQIEAAFRAGRLGHLE